MCLRYFLFDCFYIRPSAFCSLFKIRRNVIECINNDIVVGLYSKLFMRLSYYIHLGYVRQHSPHMGIKPRSFQMHSGSDTTGNILLFSILLFSEQICCSSFQLHLLSAFLQIKKIFKIRPCCKNISFDQIYET